VTAAVAILEVLSSTEDWLDADRLSEETGFTVSTIRIEVQGLVARGKVVRGPHPDHAGYVYRAAS
jgi:predicted transcriptional regulator